MKIKASTITVMKQAADWVRGLKITDAEAEKHARKMLGNMDVGQEEKDAQELWDAAKEFYTD